MSAPRPSERRTPRAHALHTFLHAEGTPQTLVLVACVATATVWAQLGLARLAAVHHATFDLAEYTRLAWGLVHGEAWDAIIGGTILGGHMPWVLAPLGALGALYGGLMDDPLGTAKTLIVAQAAALAFSGYPLFRLAARALGRGPAALLTLAYLAYPNLSHVATYEMHPGSLALLPMLYAFEALQRQRARAFAVCCALVVLCRASLCLEVMMLAALGLRSARLGPSPALHRSSLFVLGGALGYLATSVLVLQPMFGDRGPGPSSLDLHFGPWGGSPLGVLTALVREPAAVLAHFSEPSRLRYVPMVLAPFAFVSLLSPSALLVALPALAINLVSVFPTTTRIDSHYLTPALPALAVSAAAGLTRLHARLHARLRTHAPAHRAYPDARPLALAVLLVATLASALSSGMPWSRAFDASAFRPDALTRAARSVLVAIPSGASVQAPDRFLPHLAERRAVHRAPPPDRGTDFVVLDLNHRQRFAQREDLLRTLEEPIARAWLARSELGVIAHAAPFVLFARGVHPRGGYASRYFLARERVRALPSDRPLARCLAVRSAAIQPSADKSKTERKTSLVLVLRARASCAADLALRIGLGRDTRVDLLFDGLLSPAHLRAGDLVRSHHPLSDDESASLQVTGVWLSALRSSGARPEPSDPTLVHVPLD